MPIIKTTPTFSPKCPNHGCALEGCGFPLPTKGEGICPVSGAHFEFEVETDDHDVIMDKNGEVTKAKKWKLTGDEK